MCWCMRDGDSGVKMWLYEGWGGVGPGVCMRRGGVEGVRGYTGKRGRGGGGQCVGVC